MAYSATLRSPEPLRHLRIWGPYSSFATTCQSRSPDPGQRQQVLAPSKCSPLGLGVKRHPELPPRAPALDGLEPSAIVIADKGYDANSVRSCIRDQGAIPNIPNKSNRKKRFRWKKALYRHRNLVERFFNKLKQFRRIATRYDKLAATFLAFIQLASVRIFLRSIESTA